MPAWAIVALMSGYAVHERLIPGIDWAMPSAVSVVVAFVLVVWTFAVDHVKTVPHRILASLAAGAWASWVAYYGFSPVTVLIWAGSANSSRPTMTNWPAQIRTVTGEKPQ